MSKRDVLIILTIIHMAIVIITLIKAFNEQEKSKRF